MSKIAVILFNIGGPDSLEDIKPYLNNFFNDKNIIRLPNPFRWFIAKLISSRRSKGAAKEAYSKLGGKSPLLENTQKQSDALGKILGSNDKDNEYSVFISMRYWNPLASDTALQVKKYNPDKIILLPLYPQYSTATTKSSFENWEDAAARINLNVPTVKINDYPQNEGFIEASAQNIKQSYEHAEAAGHKNLRILFSAHGLPKEIIEAGDPYQGQCEQTAKAIVEKLDIENLDWAICYQSRVGPKKWLEPSIGDELIRAAEDNVPVIVYTHAFVSDHVETLVEIDIEYKNKAKDLGIPYFSRANVVGDDKKFLSSIAGMITELVR